MNSTVGQRDRGNRRAYSTSTDTGMDTPSDTSVGTPTASSHETASSLGASGSRRRRPKPSSSDRKCAPQSDGCISCKYYSLIKTAIIAGSFTLVVLGLYTTIISVELLKQRRSPIAHPAPHQPLVSCPDLAEPPQNPGQNPAPHSLGALWPGSRYIITDGNSLRASLYVKEGGGAGSLQMAEYQEGNPAQIWAVSEVDGWMSFSPMSEHGPPFFMGCKPWPSHDNLYCKIDFPDMKGDFVLKRLPDGGYQMLVWDEVGWWPFSYFSKFIFRPSPRPATRYPNDPSTYIVWRFKNIDI